MKAKEPVTSLGRRFAKRRQIINRELSFVDKSQLSSDTLYASLLSVLDDGASSFTEPKLFDVGIRRQSEQFAEGVKQRSPARTDCLAKLQNGGGTKGVRMDQV